MTLPKISTLLSFVAAILTDKQSLFVEAGDPYRSWKPVKEDDPSFFDLQAKTIEGKQMSFDRFEGYVTVVANAARQQQCEVSMGGYNQLEHLHSIYPYTLEILLFPFHTTGSDNDSCEEVKIAESKKDWKIHIMEEVFLNGPNTHPVYRYLKDVHEIDKLDETQATFFIITPDGDSIEAFRGISLLNLQEEIERHLKQDLNTEKKFLG